MDKQQPHLTVENMCCACEYDIACMNEKIKEAEQETIKNSTSARKMYLLGFKDGEQRKVEEIRQELETLRDTIGINPILNSTKIDGYKFAINEILNLKSLTNK